MKKLMIVFASGLLFGACTPKTAEVVEVKETVAKSEFPTWEIAEGSQLYNDNCGKCHKLKNVTDFTQENWKKIVPNMSQKSKLDATAENKILQFVLWKTAPQDR